MTRLINIYETNKDRILKPLGPYLPWLKRGATLGLVVGLIWLVVSLTLNTRKLLYAGMNYNDEFDYAEVSHLIATDHYQPFLSEFRLWPDVKTGSYDYWPKDRERPRGRVNWFGWRFPIVFGSGYMMKFAKWWGADKPYSEQWATNWPLLCSVLTVVLLLLIGWLLGSVAAGFVMAVLYGASAYDIQYSSQLLTESVLNFFLILSFTLWLVSVRLKSAWLALPIMVAAGAAGFITFYLKPFAVLVVGPLGLALVFDELHRDKTKRLTNWIRLGIVGFTGVVFTYLALKGVTSLWLGLPLAFTAGFLIKDRDFAFKIPAFNLKFVSPAEIKTKLAATILGIKAPPEKKTPAKYLSAELVQPPAPKPVAKTDPYSPLVVLVFIFLSLLLTSLTGFFIIELALFLVAVYFLLLWLKKQTLVPVAGLQKFNLPAPDKDKVRYLVIGLMFSGCYLLLADWIIPAAATFNDGYILPQIANRMWDVRKIMIFDLDANAGQLFSPKLLTVVVPVLIAGAGAFFAAWLGAGFSYRLPALLFGVIAAFYWVESYSFAESGEWLAYLKIQKLILYTDAAPPIGAFRYPELRAQDLVGHFSYYGELLTQSPRLAPYFFLGLIGLIAVRKDEKHYAFWAAVIGSLVLLLAFMEFGITGFSDLKLIFKEHRYLTILLPFLCLLGGNFLARFSSRWAFALTIVAVYFLNTEVAGLLS